MAFHIQLQLACLRGVDVRILVPEKSANWFLKQIGLYYARQLHLVGAKIFHYQTGFMHQKLILVDDSFTVMGSSNLDHRTIYLNFETSAIIFGREFNGLAESMLLKDFDESKLDSSKTLDPNLLTRLLRSTLRLTAPLL